MVDACLLRMKVQSTYITIQRATTETPERSQTTTFEGLDSADISAGSIFAECLHITSIIAESPQESNLRTENYLRELKEEVDVHISIALRAKSRQNRGLGVPQLETKNDFLDLVRIIQEHNESLGDEAKMGSELLDSPKKTRWGKAGNIPSLSFSQKK
jgi:hypothetical protein